MFWGVVICDLTFIAVAYITSENNADMLLAGYNTMSKNCLLYTSDAADE